MSQTPMPQLPPARFGRTMAVGAVAVGASLAGFYMNLRRKQAKKEELGTVPHYEHLLDHVGAANPDANTKTLPASRVQARQTLLPAPSKEHNSGHSTIADYKLSANSSDSGRREQPTPQRAKHAGSGVAYTKSPDYVKNYEKTAKFKPAKEVK